MTDLPTGITLTKMPIITIVMIFVTYLVIHMAIAIMLKKKQEELGNLQDKESQNYKDLAKTVKIFGILNKWFPAIAIVLILIGFYL